MAKLHLEGGVTFEGTPEEIKAYTDLYAEKAEEKEPEPAPSFKEGDIVVITGKGNIGDFNTHLFEIGELVRVQIAPENTNAGDRFFGSSLKTANHKWYVHNSYARHATQAERASLKPKLKAGDWVKFTEDGTDITAGKKYEVVVDEDDGELCIIDDGGDKNVAIDHEPYEIVAPPSVFERIGRKEGEFKVGDVVRVITGEFTLFEPGTIGELVSGAHFICPRKFGVKHGDTTQDCYDDFELIAPVESRVDAN